MNSVRSLWPFLVLMVLVKFQAPGVLAANLVEDFSQGWRTIAPSWTVVQRSPGRVAYVGDLAGDTLSQKTNLVLGSSWNLSTQVDVEKFYADNGGRAVASFALFPLNTTGVQLLGSVDHQTNGATRVDIGWYDAPNQTWRGVFNSGWIEGGARSWRMSLSRLADSDRLYFTMAATNGFSYRAQTQPIPRALLDAMKTPGFRVNNGRVHFSQTVLSTVVPASNRVLALDGQDDHASIASAPQLQNPSALSVECWVHPMLAPNAVMTFLSKGDVLGVPNECSYEIKWITNQTLTATFFFEPAAGKASQAVLNARVESNRWTHIAATFDSSRGVAQLITNGVLAAQAGAGITTLRDQMLRQTAQPLFIGGLPEHAERFATGWIDEVRVWSKTRSVADIKADLACSLSGYEPGLEGYWSFDASNRREGTILLLGNAQVIQRSNLDMGLVGCDPAAFLAGQHDAEEILWPVQVQIGRSVSFQSSANLTHWNSVPQLSPRVLDLTETSEPFMFFRILEEP